MDSPILECQICSRSPATQLPFFCPQCARNRLYDTRVHYAQVLLEKDNLSHEVEKLLHTGVLSTGSHGLSQVSVTGYAEITRDALTAELQASREAAKEAKDASKALSQEIQAIKDEINVKKKTIRQREQSLRKRNEAVSARQLSAFDPLPGNARKIETDWVRLHSAIAEDRVFLCTEVASLYGLDFKKRGKDPRSKPIYYLGDVPIIDLRELNNAAPTLVTVSLNRVAHLLHLTSHYLSLQLPAEITLPSPTNPHTIICTPMTSYKEAGLPTGQRNTTHLSKAARQRMLFLDKPLPTLAAEDQVAYSYFVDAVTLLAWNVAWLARSQGLDAGLRHWDEICAMGRNLWVLFSPQARMSETPSANPRTTSSDTGQNQAPSTSPMIRTPSGGTRRPLRNEGTTATAISPGRLSHNSAFAFLPAAAQQGGNAEVFRSWTFANPVRLIERIKSALANERMGAEWEVLEKEEWEGHKADDGSGATTPLAVQEQSSGTARMRNLLIGRIPSSDASAVPGNNSRGEDSRPSDGQAPRRGWLYTRE